MLTRRRFLTYLGLGTYGLMQANAAAMEKAIFPLPRKHSDWSPPFRPIQPTNADALTLPPGFKAEIVCSFGDALGSHGPLGPETFGYDNDFLAYFPIDCLQGGCNQNEGLLWVNHESANPLFVSKYVSGTVKTAAQVMAEKRAVGGSVVHVRREGGRWVHVPGSRWTRRFTALYPEISLTGPVAARVPRATGTLANCSGGRTPWFTALSCEENYMDFNADSGDGEYKEGLRWASVPGQAINEEGYGWVVEIDPFGELPPLKHSALGRFAHENTAMRLGPSGRLVVYMGDDCPDQYLYKFVSSEQLDRNAPRTEQRKVLSAGTLYAADFAQGRWLPLDFARNRSLASAGFKDQADVLMRCREAAAAIKATPIDRPEDCEVHPLDGALYVALTNNKKHGNLFGQIVRLLEDDDNPEGESFRFELLLAGGPQTGLACPDNLCFDRQGNLWVACDMSSSAIGKGAYRSFGNNGFFMVPTRGPAAGEAYQFASGPIDAELTGPWFIESGDTLFLSVQHPGAQSPSIEAPTSRWPDGGSSLPRPCVVAITGF